MTPGHPQPQIHTQTITCSNPECLKPVSVVMPPSRVMNSQDVSVIAFAHTRLDKCPYCGQLYLFQLQGIDAEGHVVAQWLPVRIEAAPGLIAPATEGQMKQAINNHELGKGLTTL